MTNSTGRDRIRVCLVDDHALIRQALRDRFAREPDIEVVGEAATAQSALALVGSVQPDVAVLDVRMDEMDGLEATRRLLARAPELRVILLTALDESDVREEARRAGAERVLQKSAAYDELKTAILDATTAPTSS